MEVYNFCQSCGMPLKDHDEMRGSEVDGSKSHLYCRYCYQEGKFTHPGMTLDDMKLHVRNQMQQMNMDETVIARSIKKLPMLGRWTSEKSNS